MSVRDAVDRKRSAGEASLLSRLVTCARKVIVLLLGRIAGKSGGQRINSRRSEDSDDLLLPLERRQAAIDALTEP